MYACVWIVNLAINPPIYLSIYLYIYISNPGPPEDKVLVHPEWDKLMLQPEVNPSSLETKVSAQPEILSPMSDIRHQYTQRSDQDKLMLQPEVSLGFNDSNKSLWNCQIP